MMYTQPDSAGRCGAFHAESFFSGYSFFESSGNKKGADKQGGMAHFELPPGQTSIAMTHRTVEEIWFFLSGHGEMWRKNSQQETIVQVEPNTCLTLPLGTHFQFRALSQAPLTALGVTMPPWPGDAEAVEVQGIWRPTIS